MPGVFAKTCHTLFWGDSGGSLATTCWKHCYSYRNIEVIKLPGRTRNAPKHQNSEFPQEMWKSRKNHEISANFMKVHEISWNVPFLTNFLDSGGSETLIFLRKNNDLCPGPPKDLLLAKFPQNSWKSSIFPIPSAKCLKSEKKWVSVFFMISGLIAPRLDLWTCL